MFKELFTESIVESNEDKFDKIMSALTHAGFRPYDSSGEDTNEFTFEFGNKEQAKFAKGKINSLLKELKATVKFHKDTLVIKV